MSSFSSHERRRRHSSSSDGIDDSPETGLMLVAHSESGLEADQRDMLRIGKKQEFKRNYNFLSTLGFTSIYMATWEFILVSLSAALVNGGFGGLFWVFVGTVACYSSVVASLAEMASMAPTSGGQYHWVSEFAPESWQKIASYAAGWMSTLAWLSSLTSSVFVLTTLIESLLSLSNRFTFTALQSTLLMLVFLILTIVFNTSLAHALPTIETCSLFGHLAGFLLVMIPLLFLAPKNSVVEVLGDVRNNGGWGNKGISCGIAQISVLFCCIGSDSAVHISEEVEDASVVVPRAIWYSYVLNVSMGFLMLTTMLFCIGDLEASIASPAPYLQLFKNTGSNTVALALMSLVFLLIYLGNITALATTSREVWAFSRDNGLPFSKWISKVNRKTSVPSNSIYITAFASGALCLINLISTFAFNIVISLTLLALLSTYMLSIGLVLRKRLLREALPPARWSLGKYGLPINAFAVAYCGWISAWACLPSTVPVTMGSANWAPIVWVAVVGLAAVVYWGHGRRQYTPPAIGIEGRKGADDFELEGME